MNNGNWNEHYRSTTVTLQEKNETEGPLFVISDNGAPSPHYRIAICANRSLLTLSVSIAAEHADDQPGALANFTPAYEMSGGDCVPGEVIIDDMGLLSVLARKPSASHVHVRAGWTAQLPEDFIEPVRMAISLAESALTTPVAS